MYIPQLKNVDVSSAYLCHLFYVNLGLKSAYMFKKYFVLINVQNIYLVNI